MGDPRRDGRLGGVLHDVFSSDYSESSGEAGLYDPFAAAGSGWSCAMAARGDVRRGDTNSYDARW